jgi:deazaflavin-dependent oxidoreductase (nitroreductase family)
VLLLATTGRKTGKPRTWPLGYITDGDNLIVVASNGGMEWPPAWWLNLQADPMATVQVGRLQRAVKAEQANAQERDRLWSRFTAALPVYAGYQQRTKREIPVAILRPVPGSEPQS